MYGGGGLGHSTRRVRSRDPRCPSHGMSADHECDRVAAREAQHEPALDHRREERVRREVDQAVRDRALPPAAEHARDERRDEVRRMDRVGVPDGISCRQRGSPATLALSCPTWLKEKGEIKM